MKGRSSTWWILNGTKNSFEEAKFEEGLEQGREEGLEQGREEGKSAMILGMLREKMPLEMIAKISELSLDKVRELGRMHSLL